MKLKDILNQTASEPNIEILVHAEKERKGLALFLDINKDWLHWGWSGIDWKLSKKDIRVDTDFSEQSIEDGLNKIAAKFDLARDLLLSFVSFGNEYIISGPFCELVAITCKLQLIDDDIISDLWFFSYDKPQIIEIYHEGYIIFSQNSKLRASLNPRS